MQALVRRVAAAVAALGLAALGDAAVAAPAGGVALPPGGGQAAQAAYVALYRCADDARVEAALAGLTLCDAAPTAALADRAAADNLQIRAGALVVAVAPDGVAGREGLQTDDMIFRVAHADVAAGPEAAARLAGIERESDTLVNFLRGGRPYRVKLRR